MSLRNKLIKWLGGYTDAEYQNAKCFGEPLPMPLKMERTKPVVLRVDYTYPDYADNRLDAFKRAEAHVKLGLQDAVLKFMSVRATKDHTSQTITVEGVLRVLEKEADDD
ncbi:MAG: hypothetical protein IKW44_05015 [Bacteroidaceae bacterium]|nr:hypothetical protein [Bacteroidaceae bacterium]